MNVTEDEDNIWNVILRGKRYKAEVLDEREKRLLAAGGGKKKGSGEYVLKAPMPGLVVSIPVKPDDIVQEGEVLIILESMKMQNELKSPQAGRVTKVNISEGDSVEQREVMIVLAPPPNTGEKEQDE